MREGTPECPWPSGIQGLFGLSRRHERRDAAEHRQCILRAAQHLFTQYGVDAVNMHQIALAAGVGQGTLYRRYAHKGEICMDLMHEHHERFMEETASLLATTATSPAFERLDRVLQQSVALLEEQGALLASMAGAEVREMACEDDFSRRFPFHHSPWYRWLHELLTELFTEAVRRGEVGALDVPYTVEAILATLHPIAYRFQRQECGFSPERIVQGLRRIYINGMKAP